MAFSSPIENRNAVAVFDFDGTLVTGDSLWPFLTAVAGWPRALAAFTEAIILLAARYRKNNDNPAIADYRTFIKAHLLRRLLKGKSASQIASAITALRAWLKWNESVRRALLDHHAKGHQIVIATGALDLYLPGLVKDLPAHTLICTQIEIRDGFITGEMPAGNCVRDRKAEMVRDYLTTHGPFGESWGYGNYPHDVAMLNLLKHRIII